MTIKHGTANAYKRHKCRCDECKAAKAEQARRWREAHPEYNRRWREANPEYNRRWREANPEKTAESWRRWCEANPGGEAEKSRRWREANPEGEAEKSRRWYEANPEKVAEKCARRRARKRDAFIEDVPPLEIFERDGWQCMIPGCIHPGVPASLEKPWPHPLYATIDHVIPLSRGRSKGGVHERSNLVCAHFTCNVRKGDRDGIRTA